MPFKHAASMPVLHNEEEDNSQSSSARQAPSVARTESTVCFSDLSGSDDDSSSAASSSAAGPKVAPHVGHKKVLVTGGAGFVGSHVAEYLLNRGDDVVIVDEINDYYDVKIKMANLDHLRKVCPD